MQYSIHGKRVKLFWYVVLTAALDAGVKFTLTSGNRTMDEQWDLYNKMINGTGNRAAYPSPRAPHIREGRQDHAVDVNSLDGGETRLQKWLESEGAHPTNPVSGESWHMELSIEDLTRLFNRYNATRHYPNPARRWLREYDRLKRQNKNRRRRAVLRVVMAKEALKYRKSNPKLYKSLMARSN